MTSNFLQVGRTIKCGHCANFEVPYFGKCECICHDECKKYGLERSTIETVELEEKMFKCDHDLGDAKLPCGCTVEQHDAFMCCPNDRKPMKKNTCCDGECHHDDCCGKVPANCPDKELDLDPDDLALCEECKQFTNHYKDTGRCAKCNWRTEKDIKDRVSKAYSQGFVDGQKSDPCPHLHLEDMQAFLPMFIETLPKDEKYYSERREATNHVTLFLDWMKKNVKNK